MEQSIYNQLTEILNKEYEEYLKLNDLAQAKKDTIIENKIDELSELVKKDNEIIDNLNELETKRSSITMEICRENKLNDEDITFTQLIKVIPPEWQDTLSDVRGRLLNLIDELHRQNEQNSFLITEAIKINNASLNIFINALQPEDKTYNMSNKKAERKASHIVDRRG